MAKKSDNGTSETTEIVTPPVTNSNDQQISDIAATISNDMPEPSQHAIDEFKTQEREKRASVDGLRDKDGDTFDPAKHRVDSEGNPVLSANGLLIKKPGRRSGTKTKSTVAAPSTGAQSIDSYTVGRTTAQALLSVCSLLGGEEWRPIRNEQHGIDEQRDIENAFGKYFEAKNWKDIPPGLGLTLVLTAYAGVRLTMPKTQQRVGGAIGWVKKKIADRKLRKHGLRAVETEKENKEIKEDTKQEKVSLRA